LIADTGHQVKGTIKVRHLLEVVQHDIGTEALEKMVKRRLTGLRLAPYHGCLALRPPDVAIDSSENPKSMNKVLEVLGVDVVPFNQFTAACCGSSVLLTQEDVALRLSFDILKGAQDAGADAVVTMCPLCHLNLDFKQKRMQKKYETKLEMPIIYFTQIIGLALGIAPKKLGLEKNLTSTKKIIKYVESLPVST